MYIAYNEPGYNEYPDITNGFSGTEIRHKVLHYKKYGYNEPAYNENSVMTNAFLRTHTIKVDVYNESNFFELKIFL